MIIQFAVCLLYLCFVLFLFFLVLFCFRCCSVSMCPVPVLPPDRRLENRLLLTSSPPPPPTTPVNVSSQFSFSFQSSASATESHHPNHSLTSSASSAFNVCANTSPQMINEGSILDPNDKEKSKVELVEVCMDMFSTNAFNTSSPLPLKPSMIDKLLNRQKSQMWMIGMFLTEIHFNCWSICTFARPQDHSDHHHWLLVASYSQRSVQQVFPHLSPQSKGLE